VLGFLERHRCGACVTDPRRLSSRVRAVAPGLAGAPAGTGRQPASRGFSAR
jgi:hypothetical protein